MMSSPSPTHASRPSVHSIRRSFTAPIKPPPSPVQSPVCADPSDAVAEVHFSHPTIKIVSFSPPSSTFSSAPARLRSASSPLSNDLDYPVDAIETLPWYCTTEKTVANGPLVIEKVRGSTTFLKCGQISQALMRNSQCWCVDGVSKFVIRVRALQYYRIELPSETEEDKAKVEALKATLKKILRYEMTPCPFKRGFKVDLPAEARTPKRKKAWTPRKSIASIVLDNDGRPQTAPEQNGDTTAAQDNAAWLRNDKAFHLNVAGDSNEDITDESASTSGSEISTESRGLSWEPTTPTPAKSLPKVRPKVFALEQELAKAAEVARRQSLPARLASSPQEEEEEQSGPPPNDIETDQEALIAKEQKALDDSFIARDEVQEKKPLTAVKATPLDWQVPKQIAPEDKTALVGEREPSTHNEQPPLQAEENLKKDASSFVKEPSPDLELNTDQEFDVDAGEEGVVDDKFSNEEVVDYSLRSDDKAFDLDTIEELRSAPLRTEPDSVDLSVALPVSKTASSDDSESIASSFASFHSAASEDFEDDPLTPSPAQTSSYSSFVQSPDSHTEVSPRFHKREISELTVTTLPPSSALEDDATETPSQSLQQSSPGYIPAAISSPMSDCPIVSSSTSTGPAKVGLRQRALRPRRSYSPLPHPSTLLNSPQTQSTGRRIATAIVHTASTIALGKPIEMAAMLFYVIGRIANGATVADLLSGELFHRPIRNGAIDDGNSSADEDDFGMPTRGRERSRTPSSVRRPEITRTPSELD